MEIKVLMVTLPKGIYYIEYIKNKIKYILINK